METKKSFVLFSVGINVMMKARASKATSFTSSVCPSFFHSTVTFKTQQDTLRRYCEGVCVPTWPKKNGTK